MYYIVYYYVILILTESADYLRYWCDFHVKYLSESSS